MDEYLLEAFLTALKISVSDKNLPMESSIFQSNHMNLCAPEEIQLNLKNTSYKKLGKFLTVMAQKKFITYKPGKKGNMPQILAINRNNEM